MNRIAIFATAVAIAAVPAAIGLAGNASFAQGVSVRVPAHAILLSDDGTTPDAEPGDDGSATATPTAAPSASATSDDRGGATAEAEPGDDNGGQRASSTPASDDGTHHSSSSSSTHSSSRHSSSTPSSSHTATATPAPTADDKGHNGGGKDDAPKHA